MNEERRAFSQRLTEAMEQAGYKARPGELHKIFNSKYTGISVSEMTASRWLGGKAIPAQDKLQVLADLFGVDPQVLRYGKAGKSKVGEAAAHWSAGIGARERLVIEAFLALPPKRRELVAELVEALSKPSA